MAKLKGQLFARLALDYFDHPKIARLSPEAVVAHLEMLVYSRKYLTDGVIPMRIAMRYALHVVDELASNDPVNPSVTKNEDGSLILHGYSDFQETREEVESRRNKGKQAARSRWTGDAPGNAKSNASSNAQPNATSNTETETETETTTKGDSLFDTLEAWKPQPKHYEYGKEIGVFVKDEAEKFKAHAIRNDRQLKNPNLAFTNWLKKLAPKGHPSTTSDAEAADRLRNPWKYT